MRYIFWDRSLELTVSKGIDLKVLDTFPNCFPSWQGNVGTSSQLTRVFLTEINCHPNGYKQHIKWSKFIPLFLSYFDRKVLKLLHLHIFLYELIILSDFQTAKFFFKRKFLEIDLWNMYKFIKTYSRIFFSDPSLPGS